MPAPSPTPESVRERAFMDVPLPSLESQKMETDATTFIDLTLSDDDDFEIIKTADAKAIEPAIKDELSEHRTQTAQPREEKASSGISAQPDAAQVSANKTSKFPSADHQLSGKSSQSTPPQPHEECPVDQLQMLQDFIMNHATDKVKVTAAGKDADMAELASDEEDANASAAFQQQRTNYEAKKRWGNANLSDEIEYHKALHAEDERTQLRRSKQAYQYVETLHDNEDSMFIPEDPTAFETEGYDNFYEDDLNEFLMPDSQRILFSNDFSENEHWEADFGERGRKRKPRSTSTTASRGAARTTSQGRVTKSGRGSRAGLRGRGRVRGGKRSDRHGLNMIDTNQFFTQNIIETATANRAEAAQPGFTSKNKKNALAELVAALPEDQRDLHHGDKVDLDKAVKMFRGAGTLRQSAMRADGEGGWKLRGMQTSLRHYQLLGAAFLRERENSATRPKGGILSDQMGLGKSLVMIANIVDGRPTGQNRPTLIIVPSALIEQWKSEIAKHTNQDILRNILHYTSKLGAKLSNPQGVLESQDVVITSYYEILKSMPKNEPPNFLISKQAKEEWWDEHWEKERGVFHRISWHRVVLDEAQAIKNHLSQTSEAICRLQSTYRWAISGTPIQNCLEEFYSYFRFLQCAHTGSFDLFRQNFCKKGSTAAIQRLQVYLAKIMCRRTHENKLFGAPILQLPPIEPVETIEVEFNQVERVIYDIVKSRFITKIRALGSKDTLDKNYRVAFVLLLRLRQLVSSPLLIQKTLKDLLETEDLERLWEMTEDPRIRGGEDGCLDTVQSLRSVLDTVTAEDRSMNSPSRRSSLGEGDMLSGAAIPSNETDGGGNLASEFRKYLQNLHDSGKWAKANDRSLCHACARPPVNPQITSCMHLYCESCLNDLKYEAAARNDDDATCLECGLRFRKSEAYAVRAYDEAANRAESSVNMRSGGRDRRKSSEDREEDIDWLRLDGPILQSAKTKGAVKKIKQWWAADESAKIIIFVQFRGLIKIFKRICLEQGWKCAHFDGSMPFDQRDRAIKQFTEEKDTKIMIAAMKAGGVGLNLVAANRVIIIDLWWNQSVETQAWCRVFRIGQTRDVKVARFVVKNTVDTDILAMQERKTAEIESAMEEKNRPAKLSITELLKLFGPISNDDWDGAIFNGEDEPFVFVEDPYEREDEDGDVTMTDRIAA